MAVPDFTSFFLPVLKCVASRKQVTVAELREYCASFFNLSAEDLTEMLNSGRQTRFANRIHWAKTYLQKSGLIDSPSRGVAIITPIGKKFLIKHNSKITLADLEQFDSFCKFHSRTTKCKTENSDKSDQFTPPNEQMENIIEAEIKILADDLLKEIVSAGPRAFEQLVVDVIRRMGYGIDGRTTQYVKDGGIDGIIKEDCLGLNEIYLQAKLWDHNVGSRDIQQFIGAIATHKAQKGIFITNSEFTPEAIANAAKSPSKIILINGKDLVRYMIKYNVGVQVYQTYELKKIDKDYFDNISLN